MTTDKQKIKLLKAQIRLLESVYKGSEAKVTAIHKIIAKRDDYSDENFERLMNAISPDEPPKTKFVRKLVKEALSIIDELQKKLESK